MIGFTTSLFQMIQMGAAELGFRMPYRIIETSKKGGANYDI